LFTPPNTQRPGCGPAKPPHDTGKAFARSLHLVIASAAKQSRIPPQRQSGLLRCARNDGASGLIVTRQFASQSQTHLRILAAHFARALLSPSRPQAKRAQGRPGAGLAPTVRCAQVAQKDCTAAYRCGRTPGLPCAMVGRLMPCSPGSRVRSGLPRPAN
jgi:hypothetical protein